MQRVFYLANVKRLTPQQRVMIVKLFRQNGSVQTARETFSHRIVSKFNDID